MVMAGAMRREKELKGKNQSKENEPPLPGVSHASVQEQEKLGNECPTFTQQVPYFLQIARRWRKLTPVDES